MDSECSYEQALLDEHSGNEKFKDRSLFKMSEQVSLETVKQTLKLDICAQLFRITIFFS